MKLGIAGNGMIVRQCLEVFQKDTGIQCTALCVRERSRDAGEKLAAAYSIGKVYPDYDQMLADPEVEWVYIGIVNSMHFPYAKKALEQGKHVIVEKPFTSTMEEARTLSRLARERGRFLFEAITLLYLPNFQVMREQVKRLGDIKMVQCNYSQYSSRYGRFLNGDVQPAFDPDLSGGALYDLNIYNLHFTIGLFGAPRTVQYYPNRGFNGVDTSGVAVLGYDGFSAVCTGAKDSRSPSFACVQGTRGYARILGGSNECPQAEVWIEGNQEIINCNGNGDRLAPEFAAFQKMAGTGDLQACYGILDHTLRVMDAACKARRSGGIVFPADKPAG